MLAAPATIAVVERDAVLYALSTMAQTCAALAAFVGALDIFRMHPPECA